MPTETTVMLVVGFEEERDDLAPADVIETVDDRAGEIRSLVDAGAEVKLSVGCSGPAIDLRFEPRQLAALAAASVGWRRRSTPTTPTPPATVRRSWPWMRCAGAEER